MLEQEREQLNGYQAKLDAARERLDKGEITNKELDAMKASLKADMPEAVREKAELEKSEASAARKKDVEADFKPTATDALMRQTGLGPAAPAP